MAINLKIWKIVKAFINAVKLMVYAVLQHPNIMSASLGNVTYRILTQNLFQISHWWNSAILGVIIMEFQIKRKDKGLGIFAFNKLRCCNTSISQAVCDNMGFTVFQDARFGLAYKKYNEIWPCDAKPKSNIITAKHLRW